LKLSLVSCPIALFPATSEREKISFHQLNKNTGNRIKYRKVDADSGDEVEAADIIKGYQVGKGEYLELEPDELDAIAIESKRTIEIDEFVPRKEIDELYLNNPYYIVPDGEVGQQAFAVIREAIRQEGMVAIGKVVFTSREHVIALEARDNGLLGVTLRYPYEVRKEAEYFDDIPAEKVPKDMLDLAKAHRRDQEGAFRARPVRGSLRGGAEGTAEEEAVRAEDRGAARARAVEGHQPHGCVAPQRRDRTRRRGAAQDRAQCGQPSGSQEGGPFERSREEGGLVMT